MGWKNNNRPLRKLEDNEWRKGINTGLRQSLMQRKNVSSYHNISFTQLSLKS